MPSPKKSSASRATAAAVQSPAPDVETGPEPSAPVAKPAGGTKTPKTRRPVAAATKDSARKTRAPKSESPKTGSGKGGGRSRRRGGTVMPVVPLRGMVAFPSMVLPLFIGRPKSIEAVQASANGEKLLFLVAQRDEETEEPKTNDLFEVGIVAEIVQWLRLPDGNLRVVVEGRGRAIAKSVIDNDGFLMAEVLPLREISPPDDPQTEALLRHLRDNFENAVNLSKKIPPEALQNAQELTELGPLADLIASYLEIVVRDRQKILEEADILARSQDVAQLLTREIQVLEIDREIEAQVKEGLSDNQREYFLRERLKTIQEKLGERDPNMRDAEGLRERIEAASMSAEALEKALYEVERLERMPPIAPEVGMIRNYVELMCDLPWNKRTEDVLDLASAQAALDADHYALAKIKERILEFLAVRQLNPSSRGPILCFMGPPGVGKTSIGKSIAKAMGREFIRVSVGGIHDEAEIRGHRRTYIGSMPGRIIAALRRVKVKNPVFMLDEIDKLGHDYRGDPASALLEALDPEQNNSFSDHYLEVPFDLSEVMFIATGNLLDPIQPALRDRMEVLNFPGYTELEKLAIAKGFLVPKQVKENGITVEHITFTDAGIIELIRGYSREAGVRNLERELGTVCRKVARKVADGSAKGPVEVVPTNLKEFLGPRRYSRDVRQERDEIGVAQGLAWTEAGGEVLAIEVLLTAGVGNAKQTGNLGPVMKESCDAAMTYARAHASELGIEADFAAKHDAHIHVPAGAVPKDGPSAGVAIATALVSAMSGRPARKDVAMTGEISLRGHVMAVGGVKEKILAAHRVGATELILPAENERDLDELPAEVRDSILFHLVDRLDVALKIALLPADTPSRPASPPATNGLPVNGTEVKARDTATSGASSSATANAGTASPETSRPAKKGGKRAVKNAVA